MSEDGRMEGKVKRMNRREFTKTVGGVALAAPLLSRVGAAAQSAAQTPAPAAIKPPGADLPLTPEQQERVRSTLERDARRRAQIRPSALPYDLEPAFVFTVRQRPRGARKGD
jgi:hypothetical protein